MESARASCHHGDHDRVGVVRRESGQRKKIRYFSSDNALFSKGGLERGRVTPLAGETYPGGQLELWKKRLGLREGSVFTGSLPDLVREGEEVEGEEGEEGGRGERMSTLIPER